MSQLNHALRAQGVTGSEIAAVAGLSRYGGPLEVWGRKTGRIPPLQENANMRRGNMLEPSLCTWAAEERGLHEEDVGTIRSESHQLVIASPDRLLHTRPNLTDPVEVLEVKSPARTQHLWTSPDDDPAGIDPQYLPQVTWEMAAAGLPRATVGALCYGDLWLYRLELDEELLGLLLGAAERFWKDHVETGTPPLPHCAADADLMRHLYPVQREPLSEADEYTVAVVARWRELDDAAKAAADAALAAKAEVQARIGDAEGYYAYPDGGWKVTWRNNKASRKTDWKAVARTAGATDELIAKHTTEKPGARVLRYSEKGGAK